MAPGGEGCGRSGLWRPADGGRLADRGRRGGGSVSGHARCASGRRVETYAYFQVSACWRFRVHHRDLRRTARTWLSHVHNPSMSESRQDPGSRFDDGRDFLIKSRRMSSVQVSGQGHKSGSARLRRALCLRPPHFLCVSLCDDYFSSSRHWQVCYSWSRLQLS